MSKILITGATGFIGSSLVPVLVLAGHQVRCAVWQKVDFLPAEQIIINKLEQNIDWSEALEGIDIVIHLAARVHIMNDTASSSLDEYCKVNSIATKKFAEQASAHGVRRFVFLSSIKVHGEFTKHDCPLTEDSPVNPEDPYALSKLYAEDYLRTISKNTGMQIVILRPPLVYGPRVRANFLKIIKLVSKGFPLPFGKVNNKRSFIFLDNLISAICAVLSDPRAANQVYLVADDESLSLTQLIELLSAGMNANTKLFSVPVSVLSFVFKYLGLQNLNSRLFASLEVCNHKIKTQLEWTPPVSSAKAIGVTAKWYRYEYNA